jgi:hypothetical protein
LIAERLRNVCKAVRKEVRSAGDGGGGASGNIDCRGVVAEPARAREKLCLRDEKLIDVEFDNVASTDGDGGRAGTADGEVFPFRLGEEAGEPTLLGFFLVPNDLRKDHSDSN